ncbi:MAG: hypothetical protein K9G36_11465 [Crocinitomicaceae bacterium]|nr:hypothetical protein [Crocinitomicaceae bacterium]
MSTTLQQPQANLFSADKSNIDLRIDKKEFDIFTEDCTCIIDEVEFVKIIDLKTNMSLPVVALPQAATTPAPRRGMPKFLSRMFNRMAVLPLTLPLCLMLVLGVGNVWGQAILTFEFSALAGDEATANSNFNNSGLTSSTISRGAGLTAGANGGRYNASSWATTSIANAVSGNDYMEFTITPNSGKQFSVSSIVAQWQRSATGNTQIALRSSVDNYASNLDAAKAVTDNTNTQTFTWTFAQANSSTAVTYRFYSYAESNTGTGGPGDGTGNDITVNGSVSDVATAPTIPTITTITPSNQQLSVAFTAGSDGGSAITNYKYSTNGGTNWQTRATGTTASPLVISTLSTDGSTALTNGTSYNIQIRAVNTVGDGTATASTAATPRTTPSAPTITGITPGNQQLSVAFTAGSDGGSSITTYKYSTNGGANWQTRSSGTTASPLVISTLSTDGTTALTNGVSYDIQIRAVNAAGDGTASSTTSGTPAAPVSPTLNAVTLSSSLSSTYGTASTGVSFTASGSNLTGNITATAQSGYEVSTSLGSGYDVSVSVASGTTVYVRFASTISAGNKDNATAVVLSGGGASSDANVTTSSSGNTVSQKALTVTGLSAQNKVYDGLTTATATGTAALSGVVSPDAVSLSGTPTFTFVNATVGTSKTVNTTNYSLTGAQASNYSLTQPTLSANITVRSLTVTANNVSKVQGVLLSGGAGSTAFTSSGLQNSETIGSVTIAYGTAGATNGDGNTVGVYASQVTPSAATGGTFTAGNYSISYVAGSITVTQAPCGTESFTNSNATASYSDNSFSGDNGVTWTFTQSQNNSSYQINGTSLLLRRLSDNSKVVSGSVSGGIGNFTCKLLKGFTGAGNRQVALYINNIFQANSTAWDNTSVQTFTVNDINITGSVVVEIRNITANQVVVDDISWTCYSAPEINIKQSSTNLVSGSGSFSLGTVTTGSSSSATTFTIENTGTATLNITGTPKVAISGHTSDFTIDETSTSATISASGSTTFTVTFSPTTTGARSATISIANDDSNENPYTFTVTGTGATYAPSVTTSAATLISTTGATLNGEVTSDGGATVTERGFVYKTSNSVTISDNKTVVAGTTGTFSLSPTSLSVNTQYYFRAYAINSVNTTLGSELNFWTLANAPAAPTVNTPTGSSLNVTIGASDGNSAITTYAIQETTSGNYVQANGTLGASAVWQTSSTWSAITVIGLSSATTYTFQVKARNGANTETAFGSTTSGTTSSIGLNAVILSSALTSTYGTASAGVSFTASGTNLTSNITATAQTGYQVSIDDLNYGSSVSVASGTTVYVSFASTLVAGNYDNQVALVLSGGGASSDANVTTSLSANTVSKATPTINSSPTATAITFGQTLASSTLSGGSASVVGSFAFTTPSTAPNAGTANQSVTFTPTDNANYNTATSNVSVTVNKANQTINFGALADKTTADSPFALTGTASSGLTVSYSSSNTAVATIAGSTVTIVGAGQTTITASQVGDANYNAATSLDQTLTVTIPACVTNSNQTGGWNFTTASPSSTISNLTIGDLSQGNNNGTTTLINGTSASSVYTGASGGNNAGAAARTGALTPGASGSAYFQFTLTPANGYNFTLTGISFGSRSTGTGPQAYALRSSLDNYASNITTGSLSANSTWALKSNTGLSTDGQGNANPVTFRLYGYNGSGSPTAGSANWRIDDLTLTVTVSNAPSSASVGSTQNLCGTLASTALGGNTPALGTGTWSQTSGPGTTVFSALNSGSSTATADFSGSYEYKWSINNGCATVNEASVTVNYNSIPSAPSASVQSFCSASSPTVTNLSATGSNIQWYDASSNGNLLASGTVLTSGNYYASQSVSGCESTTRTSVAITINSNPTAPTASAQSFCSSASPTVADLTVTSGSSIQWYDASTNGNLVASGTSLTAGTYYASQTVSSCESATRTSVAVTINSNGTWIGDSNDDWNIAGNWCGGVPNSSLAVVSVPTGVVVNLDTSPSVLNLTIGSGATINAGTYSINIADGGSITNNGTFNAQTSELIFSGAGTISGTTAMAINNLTLNGALTINSSPTVDGIVQLNNGASVLNSSIIYTVNAYLYYNQSGSVSSSSFEWPTNNGPNKVAIYNGTNLSLNENKSLNTNLSLANGRLTFGDYHLTLGESATITGTFSSNNMIIASGLGELRKRFAQGSGDIAAFTFPVGNGGSVAEYTPIVLDFASGNYGANAHVGVRVKDSKQATLNSSLTNYLNRNWIIEPNDITGYSYKIQLHYVDADFVTDGSMAEGDLKPIKISSGQWYQPTDGSFTNAVSQGSAGIFASANYLEWNGLTTFSEFGGAGGSNQPLPVELLSFSAECANESITLKWQTASEFNSSHFEVEKSTDGLNWNTIGQLPAAGNSNELLNYSFQDVAKSINTIYYRLNQVDNDGLQKYYGPISPMCETSYPFIGRTIPNPSENEFWLHISTSEQQTMRYTLQDINGTKIIENTADLLPGSNMFPIRETIPSGMYFILLQTEKGQQQVIKHVRN